MVENNIKWGSSFDGLAWYYRTSPDYKIQRIARNWIKEVDDNAKLMRIRMNNYATFVKLLPEKYVSDTDMLDDYAINNLKTLSECIGEYATVFVLKQESHYINVFNRGIQALSENGLINYWYGIIRYKHNKKYLENFYTYRISRSNVPLNLQRLIGLICLLLLGNLTALLLFVVEHIVDHINTKH